MAKDVNIHVKTQGAEIAGRQLQSVADATKQIEAAVERTVQPLRSMADATTQIDAVAEQGASGVGEFSNATEKMSGSLNKAASSLGAFIGKYMGLAAIIAGVTWAIREQNKSFEENARIIEERQSKFTRLQMSGDVFKQNPNLRKEISDLSVSARRPFGETADAWLNVEQKGSDLSKEQRKSILNEALELGRTDPEMKVDKITDMLLLYAKKTKEKDANRIQNVLYRTINESGAGGAEVEQNLPKFLDIATKGGLSGAEASGLWAFASKQSGDTAKATSDLTAIFGGLQGKGSPESLKMLKGFGIDQRMGFFDKLDILTGQRRAGKFGLAEAQQLTGEREAGTLLSMLDNPQGMYQTINRVRAVDTGEIDLTAKKLNEVLSGDKTTKEADEIKKKRIEIENQKAVKGESGQGWDVYLNEIETRLRDQGLSAWETELNLKPLKLKRYLGFNAPPVPDIDINAPSSQKKSTTVINNYSHTMNYNPTVGDNKVGPRTGDL